MQSLILDPPAVYQAVDKAAYAKAHYHWLKVFLLAIMSGLFLSLGCQGLIATTAVDSSVPYVLLGSFLFSFGLISIIHLGAELFTGNCLMLMAVFNKHITVPELLIEWLFTYIGNFVGSILFAVVILGTGVNGYPGDRGLTDLGEQACKIAIKKAELEWWEMFFRGVLANFCVCTAVLLAISSKSAIGKQFAITWPLVVFIICGYEHSIANMYFFSEATLLGCQVSSHGYYWLNLLLSSVGNLCGASILAVVYWYTYMAKPGHLPPQSPEKQSSPSVKITEPVARRPSFAEMATKNQEEEGEAEAPVNDASPATEAVTPSSYYVTAPSPARTPQV